jgi:hypothetical protein
MLGIAYDLMLQKLKNRVSNPNLTPLEVFSVGKSEGLDRSNDLQAGQVREHMIDTPGKRRGAVYRTVKALILRSVANPRTASAPMVSVLAPRAALFSNEGGTIQQ